MKPNTIVSPSTQVNTALPQYITETYQQFVKFITIADQSEERIGFSQDLLQNLQKYRDFENYNQRIVQAGVLQGNITATDEELTLEDGKGFPEENGVIQIDEEVILYRRKEGNTFYELQRGASGTVILPTFTQRGTYIDSVPAAHTTGSSVKNVSVLFLVGLLKTIYQSFVPNINPERVSVEINSSTLLENIKDFFQAKGSKLGIKALFKILFAENDVDVHYPGDRMAIPSKSTWSEAQILRVTPQPSNLVDPAYKIVLPTEIMNSVIKLRSYNDDTVYATSICDYVSSYPYEDVIQYEIYLNKDKISGNFIANPVTRLSLALEDETTVTVESTLGFANSGIFFVGREGITYESKTLNQFLGCKRGVKGHSYPHAISSKVYGPYYIESSVKIDDIEYTSISYPLGLVKDIDIVEGGLLHRKTDDVFVNGPGRVDPRVPALASFVENYDDQLVTQAVLPPDMPNVSNYTAGVNGIYFDKNYIFVSSSGFPYYTIGKFSDNGTVGQKLHPYASIWAIPRIKQNNEAILTKGNDEIGISVDGVPIYSESSSTNLTRGIIERFVVRNTGNDYITPTVLIDPPLSSARAIIENGQIVGIEQTTVADYVRDPSVRITSGEGALLGVELDNYGRLINVSIFDNGLYYKDVPSLKVVDATGRGTGAVLSCTVDSGFITTVKIENPGIDYNNGTTEIQVISVGSGAQIDALIERYTFNRYQTVINNVNWTFDSGNGFIWGDNEEPPVELDTFGYVCNPTQLRTLLNDDGTKHSPILGWAFDGNPIYGPYGWKNLKNDSGGLIIQKSGYVLRDDRDDLGSLAPPVGPYDPEVGTYPMGTFTEDYIYKATELTDDLISTELGDPILTELGLGLDANVGFIDANILDTNNGKICNTPEFPEEEYPDGVYAYFITVDSSDITPQFPYYIGTTFHNRPLSQVKELNTDVSPDLLKSVEISPSSYDKTEITFNLDLVERYRNPYLNETKDEINLEIADVTKGGISSIIVESGLPANSKAGDLLYYPDPTTGGSGAEGVVSFVTGEDVVDASGDIVRTNLRSHRQVIDLSEYRLKETFVFVQGTQIYDTSGAIGRVNHWNTLTYQLEVQCETYHLFKFSNPATPDNPFFLYDNRGTAIRLPDYPTAIYRGPVGHTLNASRPNRVLFAKSIPSLGIGGLDPEPGDLAWSIQEGRLFVYYDDGATSQWVESQPVGSVPLGEFASNIGVGVDDNVSQDILSNGGDNTVTISTTGPSQRADGTPNEMGDLWWSCQTGILYIWYIDINGTSQWVMTEPSATVPGIGSLDQLYPDLSDAATVRGNVFSRSIVVTISETAPTKHSDDTPIEVGDLWWSSANGKMYIYYEDTPGTATNSVQWVQCNPVGSITSEDGSDDPINPDPGPGPNPPTPVPPVPPPPGPIPDPFPGGDFYVLPELRGQKLLWFRDMNNFLPTDLVDFPEGLPASEELTEEAQISSVGQPDFSNGVFNRGYNDLPLLLPEATPMLNRSRAVYSLDTAKPHNLNRGDLVFIEGSDFPEVNGIHPVGRGGVVVPATLTVTLGLAQTNEDEVVSITIDDPGQFYTRDFLISFFGGGGQGAFASATVEAIELGGGIKEITILSGGTNYIDPPTPILGDELTNKQFEIYVQNLYDDETGSVKYSTDGAAVENTVAYIKTTSAGGGYVDIPPAIGLIKKQSDRAAFIINSGKVDLEGQSINSVAVIKGGSRYTNPVVLFGDRLGSGSGATANLLVVDGQIKEVYVTSGGSGYIEPVMTLIEEDGKYISLTRDIGRITAGTVINPGRDISIDRSVRPELQITTRCIIRYTASLRGEFAEGSKVYQGTPDKKLVTATVVSYDDAIQQLTLEKVDGVLRANEELQDDYGTKALVLLEGEADCRAIVSGSSEPKGVFINQTSQISSDYAVIQDSKKYQWFSYEISSGLMRKDYETLIKDIVHPTGFIMFSELEINQSVVAEVNVIEPEIKPFI